MEELSRVIKKAIDEPVTKYTAAAKIYEMFALRQRIYQERALEVRQKSSTARDSIYVKFNPLFVSTQTCIERHKPLLNLRDENEKFTT